MKISSILFIDPSVNNYEILLTSAVAYVKSIVLAPNKDGVAQITETLRHSSDVESVHIISHGSPGTLYVGNSELSLSTLELYADQLKNWFSPSDSPHLLLYGCNVAAGDAGGEFITKLHQLTGANIAASANLTGNVALGGDWNLEVNIGNNSNQPLALSAETMAAYPSVLNTPLTAANKTLTINPDSVYTFAPTDFNFADADSDDSDDSDDSLDDSLQMVQITQLPPSGEFVGKFFQDINSNDTQDDGEAIVVNQTIAQADLNKLKFIPATDPSSTNYDFQFKVSDDSDDSEFSASTYTISVEIDAVTVVNNAPVLGDTAVTLTAINKGAGVPTGAVGTLVSSLLILGSNVTDPDTGALTGIAITNANTTNGSFFYSIDNGTTWTALEAVSNSNALLLEADDTNTRIYFQPTANFSGTINDVITFRAWDKTTGSNGNKVDTTTNGGSTAFSITTESAAITINESIIPNSAPTLTNTNVILSAVSEDAGAPTGAVGTLVSSLLSLGGNVTDPDTGALTGIAITNANTTNGSFFYSIDNGAIWTPLAAVSNSNALLLAADDTNTRIYFQPTANFSGTIDDVITFRAWDKTIGSNGNKVDTTTSGGSTAFSLTTDTAAITINAVNDAPVLSDTNLIASADKNAGAPIGEDGELISSLLSLANNITDPDKDALKGVAITNADTTKGSFFYSTNNGTTWTALEAVSNSNALLLAADDTNTRIYFQPTANFSGTLNDVITFRAWDQTSGSNGTKVDTTINGGSTAFSIATDTASIIVEDANTPLSLKLLSNNLDLFQLQGVSDSDDKPKLEVTLTGFKSRQVNELGVFIVDDDQGRINGIAPGANGYAQAALAKSKVIFSAISDVPNGFDTNLTSLLEFNPGDRFRFLLIKDSTIDSVRNGKTSFSEVLFSDTQTAKVTDLGNQGYTLAFKDALNSNTADFQDVVVRVKPTDQSLPLGAGLQGNPMGELIDLRNVSTQVKAEFVLNREAAFDNFVGFYRVADVNGGIDTDGNGAIDFRPGDAGYTEAAVRRRVPGIDLTVSNQGTATFTGTFEAGSLLAPFIIANGRPEAVLDNDASNNPAVYFPFLGANSDQTDHVRLLGNNTFGFEDLANGGDKDYNDVTVKVKLSVA